MNFIRKAVLAGALGAATLVAASPAMADPYYGHRGRGGDTTGAAIAGGVIGLALGAAIASDRGDRYYDGGYYNRRAYPRYRTYYAYRDYPRYYRPQYYRNDYYRNDWRRHEWRERNRYYGGGYYGRGW